MNKDVEFVQQCVSGSRQAWEEFLIRYSRLIYAYISSTARLQGAFLSSPEREDFFQEIVLSLLDNNFCKLKSYRGLNGCRLASWLRQVTVNFTLNRISRKNVGISLDQHDPDGLPLKETIADPSSPAVETVQEKEENSRLSECIELLETDDKYFLELNLHLGLNLEQIRAHLKITRGAADMRKARIVERLRECFKKRGEKTWMISSGA